MANTFSLIQRPPNPLKMGVGRPLLSRHAGGEAVEDLLLSSNWCAAWGGTASMVSQGWGGSMASRTAVLPALGTVIGSWKMPRLGPGYGTLEVGVWAEFTGIAPAKGQVRFEGLESGTSVVIDIAAGAAALHTATLAVQEVAGEETILFAFGGDGVDACVVHEAFVEYQPLSSPLPAGVVGGAAGTVTPFDEAEADPDSALSADQGTYLIDNYGDFFDRPRVYLNLTTLQGIDDYLPNFEYKQWIPIHPGAAEAEHELEIRVEATGLVGDSRVYIYLGRDQIGRPGTVLDTVVIDVPAAAARQWYSTTYAIRREERRLHRMPHPFTHIAIFPSTDGCRPYNGSDGRLIWGGPWGMFGAGTAQNGNVLSPQIHAVSIWGV